MGKKEEINSIKNSLVSGFIAKEEKPQQEKPKEEIKEVKKNSKKSNEIENIDVPKNPTLKDGETITGNSTVSFKIDADIEEYFKNIDKITFIESIKQGKPKSLTKKELLNSLIRREFYKLIGASDKDTSDSIEKKWLKYKDNNNL